jgi:PAS domain S-box-containing protein
MKQSAPDLERRSPNSGPWVTPPQIDLSSCARELIHIPGAVQPHGAVLAAQFPSGLVTHASANLAAILGQPAAEALGRPLEEVIGAKAFRTLFGDAGLPSAAVLDHACALPDRARGALHLRAFRSGQRICMDIEPLRPETWQRPFITRVQSVLETLKGAATCVELCELAVRGLSAISGYDRVMAYRFAKDGHGEIIAEVRPPEFIPFLGLHYPASDVPPQARLQSLRQRVGAVADTHYTPALLLVDPLLHDHSPLDLGHSALRSVSPVHCEYLRNMNAAATLTIALVDGSDLWGMLVCHHSTPRVAGPELRAVAEIVGQVVSLKLQPLKKAEVETQWRERVADLNTLIVRLSGPARMVDVLAASSSELLALVGATGAVARISGDLVALGRPPAPAMAERALAVLQSDSGGQRLDVDDLGLRYPEFASCAEHASGVLLLPLTPDGGDAILWFRPEYLQTVLWGGEPIKHAVSDSIDARLSPRKSFAAWKQQMSGRSSPWTEIDLAVAEELRRAIETATAHRSKEEIARLEADRAEILQRNRLVLACLDRAPFGITLSDATRPQLPLIYVNRMFTEITGYESGEVIGRNTSLLLGPATDPEVVENIRRTRTGSERAEFQILNYRKDSTPFLNHLILEPIQDDAGGVSAYLGMFRDITKDAKHRTEAQRQKMEALGRMMGAVAHEINNLLQPVMLLGQDALDRGLVAVSGRQHLDTILECSRRSKDIIGDLLAFSRPRQTSSEVHDPAELLNEALRLVRQAMPTDVAVSVRVEGSPPSVAIDHTGFVQVLLNLAVNAAAAMDGGGELTILLDETGPGLGEHESHTRFMRLRVTDTGCGMDEATLDHAFEPFFTTKPVGKGTGLGLSVVYGLVREMGGIITFESEPGQGTTVTILAPGCNEETADAQHIGS